MRLYEPMLARTADRPFSSKEWIFELKWDGVRAISYIDDGLSIRGRNNYELLGNFPEFEELRSLAGKAVLDGEIVVLKGGKADFQALMARGRSTSAGYIEAMSKKDPALYIVFDILEEGGKPLLDRPLSERKEILKKRVREGNNVLLSLYIEGDGEAYYSGARRMGLEGIMAKRKDSVYEPGVRSGSWLKIKSISTCDCIIFGYTEGEGKREGGFGALILGLYDDGGAVFVGKVGTGFSNECIKELLETFKPFVTESSTLGGVDVPEQIIWLKPELVCEVAYQSVTHDLRLRMPRFKVLRKDKKPSECRMDQIVLVEAPANLLEYRKKRKRETTPEPFEEVKPEGDEGGRGTAPAYVVQEHHARRLHYDLRLEREGVLKSWAVPKGLPEKPGEKRLAVETEDHPLAYGTFEGEIPKGEYGAGKVIIWDKGSYEPIHWDENTIEVIIKGQKASGRYILTRFKKAGERQWLLLKVRAKEQSLL